MLRLCYNHYWWPAHAAAHLSGLQVQCPAHAAAHLSVYVRCSVVYSMNSEMGGVVLFKDWSEKHFVKHAVASRPLLLLLDGHNSHNVLDTSKFAKEKT